MRLGAWQLPNSPSAAKHPEHTDVPRRKQILPDPATGKSFH